VSEPAADAPVTVWRYRRSRMQDAGYGRSPLPVWEDVATVPTRRDAAELLGLLLLDPDTGSVRIEPAGGGYPG
jgi:hypothetical protein